MASLVTRKHFLVGAAASAAALSLRPARAARPYTARCGIDLPPSHPICVSAVQAAAKVKDATQGAVVIDVFPNNELGDDTHMLSEIRSGAIQMMACGDSDLAVLVPKVSITNVGFAFKDSATAYKAVDGEVGTLVRKDIIASGLHVLPRAWDEGLRQITSGTRQINTPDDLHGFKIRVPPSPIMASLFQSLGASPLTLNISELYTAMQTHVADGEENSLAVIEAERLYEVQKYCSITNHMWIGYWILVNGTFWNSLPANYRQVISDSFDEVALSQRQATQNLNASLEAKLKQQGLIFATPDQAAFRAALAKSGFYKKWETTFGPTLWSALETYTGPLG